MTDQDITIRATFEDKAGLERALKALQKADVEDYQAYAPVRIEDLAPYMPRRGSPVRGIATLGGITGLFLFWYMCVATSLIYKIITQGKPPWSNVPFVIPTYEGTILLGAFGAFIAVVLWAVLWARPLSKDYDLRFGEDGFGVSVTTRPSMRPEVFSLLKDAGAGEVFEIKEVIE